MDIDNHMPDDQKITFGNDSDFIIFHGSGGNTSLRENGTGNLFIDAGVVTLACFDY